MKVLAFGTATFAAVILAAGCSSTDASKSQAQAVQGGTVDTTHSYAVGVMNVQKGLLCSGALIAPNLVMTARHCVDQSPQAIDCTSSSTVFSTQYTASSYYITTYYNMNQQSNGWHQAKQIFRTPGNKVCGNDMALIMLADNVSLQEAGGSYVTPVVQYSMTDHTRYSTTVTAIGFGDTSATTQDAGTRHILQDINLACIPGDSAIDCPSQAMTQMTVNEFISGDSTCEGDSGSSAYEQKAFDKNVPVSFGVLSRGGSSGSTCVQPVYTRTDAWKDFIVQTAQTAAQAGGYTAPAWTSPAPPNSDGGTTTSDSGTTTSDGAAPPPPGSLGATCADNSDCDSGLCLSNDGGTTYVCSASCDPSGNGSDCGQSGYVCQADGQGNGYCFAAPPSSSFSNGGGGCSIGKSDPSKPVPWGTVAIAGAWVFAFGIRRRRKP